MIEFSAGGGESQELWIPFNNANFHDIFLQECHLGLGDKGELHADSVT